MNVSSICSDRGVPPGFGRVGIHLDSLSLRVSFIDIFKNKNKFLQIIK